MGKVDVKVWATERALPSQPSEPLSAADRRFQDCVREMVADLSNLQPAVRRQALEKLASLNLPAATPGEDVNLHTHTFFSYHAANWSPSRFAWEARQAGLQAAGIIDFDALDGVEEFLDAAELLGLRGTAGIEVRAFLEPFADQVIDSPGEPGVHYVAGSGMVTRIRPRSAQGRYLKGLRGAAAWRNRGLVARINAQLPAIAIDYRKDVVPLSAGGNPTERHIVQAYLRRSRAAFPDSIRWSEFWCGLLGIPSSALARLVADGPALEEKARARLAKQGGIGYAAPDAKSFPRVAEVFAWIKACGGIPLDSWLDGSSPGESRARDLFACMRDQGALGLNLIPDRNWNVADPEEKRRKLASLDAVIRLAREWKAPIHIGTEGNKAGLPFADDLGRPELAPYRRDFIAGAHLCVGHAVLARFADFPYAGPAADAEFGARLPARNAFFEAVGALPPLDAATAWYLRQVGPAKSLEAIRVSLRRGYWTAAPLP